MILRLFKLAIVFFFLFAEAGCAIFFNKEEYLNTVPPYSELINQNYKVKTDCLVIQIDSKDFVLPQIVSLNDKFALKTFGLSYDKGKLIKIQETKNLKILDLIPEGTTFKVTGIKRIRTFENERYHYEINLSGDLSKKWPLLDAIQLTVVHENPNFPPFDKHFVTPY